MCAKGQHKTRKDAISPKGHETTGSLQGPKPTEIKANRQKTRKTLPQANEGAKRQVDNRNAATTVQDQQ